MSTKKQVGSKKVPTAFPLIRTYLKECVATRVGLSPQYLNKVLTNERLELVRRQDRKSFQNWLDNAKLHAKQKRRNISNDRSHSSDRCV